MDFVQEQDVAFLQVRKNGSQVARTSNGRTARGFDVRPELVRDDGGQRGLSQTGRARKQNMVHRFTAPARRFDQDGKAFLDFRLP